MSLSKPGRGLLAASLVCTLLVGPAHAAEVDAGSPEADGAIYRGSEEGKLHERAFTLYKSGEHDEALTLYLELARLNPRFPGALASVGATLVSRDMTREQADRLAAEADAAPADPLAQYVAGIANHYYAYSGTKDLDEKREFYRRTIRLLERALPAYDFATRVYIYLAVSYFRLGDQAGAMRSIDRAIELGRVKDPDVFYCRAEILRHHDPAQAILDLRTYIDTMEAAMKRGAIVRSSKERAVRRTYEKLVAIQRGELQLARPFDPMSPWGELPTLLPWERRALGAGGGVMAIGVVAGGLALRRRSRRAPPVA